MDLKSSDRCSQAAPALGMGRKRPPRVYRRPGGREPGISGHLSNWRLPVGSSWPRNCGNLPSHCGGEQGFQAPSTYHTLDYVSVSG